MARKPSVIMSAQDRKEARSDLRQDVKDVKESIKAREQQIKVLTKELAIEYKKVQGLETRLDALKEGK